MPEHEGHERAVVKPGWRPMGLIHLARADLAKRNQADGRQVVKVGVEFDAQERNIGRYLVG